VAPELSAEDVTSTIAATLPPRPDELERQHLYLWAKGVFGELGEEDFIDTVRDLTASEAGGT